MKRWIHASEDNDSYDPFANGIYRVMGGYETRSFDDPVKAIEMWFRFQRKNPQDVMIMSKTRQQAVDLCRAATADLLTSLADKYGCPYKVDYLINEAAEKVADGQKYFYENDYGYGDQIHPFSVG